MVAQLEGARRAVEKRPTRARLNGELGALYRVYLDFDAAEVALRRARMLAPRDADWIYYHGEVLERLGRVEESLEAMRAVLDLEPANVPARLRTVRLSIMLGQLDQAAAGIESLLADAPEYASVHAAHAELLERRGEFSAALEALRRAIDVGGPFGKAHYTMALLHRRLKNARLADKHMALFQRYRHVLMPQNDPRMTKIISLDVSEKALQRAARAADARGENERVLKLLELALERNPDSVSVRVNLIAGYSAVGQIARAEEVLEQGFARAPQNVDLFQALGRLRLQQGRLTEALEAFTDVTRRAPQHPEGRTWLGHTLELSGRNREAGIELREAVEDNPGNITARLHYSKWLLAHAEAAEAIEQLRKMTAVATADGARVHGDLSVALQRDGDIEGAREELARAIELASLWGDKNEVARLRNVQMQLESANREDGR